MTDPTDLRAQAEQMANEYLPCLYSAPSETCKCIDLDGKKCWRCGRRPELAAKFLELLEQIEIWKATAHAEADGGNDARAYSLKIEAERDSLRTKLDGIKAADKRWWFWHEECLEAQRQLAERDQHIERLKKELEDVLKLSPETREAVGAMVRAAVKP